MPDEGRVRDSSNQSNGLNLAPRTPIDEWVSRYGAPLYHFACGMTHDRFAAENIVQEVFIRAWQTHQRRPQNPLSAAWFYHVTRNLCTDHFRRSRNTTPLDDASFAVDGVGHDAHVTGLGVRQVIRQLGRADQVCLWLFYYGDWPLQDIAAELGITVDAVKTRLTRAPTFWAAMEGAGRMTDPHMSPEERAQIRADLARLLGPVGTLPPNLQLRPPAARLTAAPRRRAWYWRVFIYGAVVYVLGAGGIVAAESAGLVPNPHIPGIPGPITFHHNQLPIPTTVPPVPKTPLPRSVKISAGDAKTIVVHYIESMRHTQHIIPPVITGIQLEAAAAVEQHAGAQRGLSPYLWAVSFRSTDFLYTHGTMWVNTQTGQIQIQHFPPSALPPRS